MGDRNSIALKAAAAAGAASITGIAAFLYVYCNRAIGTRDPSYHGVPYRKDAVPLLGHALEIMANQEWAVDNMMIEREKYGATFSMTAPFRNIVATTNIRDLEFVLKDPYLFEKGSFFTTILEQFLGEGIFNSDGDHWKAQRKIGSNIFNVKNFRDLFSTVFVDESKKLVAQIRKAQKLGAYIELQNLLLRATLDSFTMIAMGKSTSAIEGEGKPEGGIYTLPPERFMEAFDGANQISTSRFGTPFFQWVEWWTGKDKEMKAYIKTLDDFALRVVNEKRAQIAAGHKGHDLLELFLATSNEYGRPLTDKQLRDVSLNFILAGRDTTAQTLSWTFWEIAQHPEVELKCREELLAVLGHDGDYKFEFFKDLKYNLATFLEALRLHSNVPGNTKKCTKDCVLPGSGAVLKAGDNVVFSTYVIGRSKEVWGEDASEFKPERWFDASGSIIKPNQYAFPHFNAGPRICLGMNMAQQEAVVFQAAILRNFHLELVNEDDPRHWGKYDTDPAKRMGRASPALTLSMRNGVNFKTFSSLSGRQPRLSGRFCFHGWDCLCHERSVETSGLMREVSCQHGTQKDIVLLRGCRGWLAISRNLMLPDAQLIQRDTNVIKLVTHLDFARKLLPGKQNSIYTL
ncbi:hypothetical protein SeMB42_g05461 [Synchytrium endobioticum]|uniref:Cytochrome P450 n=1 Tax=Synchytrium endobioticum TaxID=286115 RepID=A0A507CR99_9FUNG|nr:hypothetical protein SeMB42_g05461 [Synchytrium endobioticum]